jgi:hypothetical protein
LLHSSSNTRLRLLGSKIESLVDLGMLGVGPRCTFEY